MANHSSATVRVETPHANRTTRTNTNALKQRAQSVLNDKSVNAQSRAILRHVTEKVRRADAGETIDETDEAPQRDEVASSRERSKHSQK